MEEKEMTKQEAIDTLKLYSNNRFGIVSEPFWKALNIVLEALKSQNSDEPDWENEAPEWANYYAIDKDGDGYWYENFPVNNDGIYSCNGGRIKFKYGRKIYHALFKRPDK